jgi:hypothetical protein
MFTSSGARTTAGWEAGAERLRPDENLEDAAERIWKVAAEGLGMTGGLEAAAEYKIAEEVATLQEGSESSAAAGSGVGFGAGATSAATSSDATGATSDADSSAFE